MKRCVGISAYWHNDQELGHMIEVKLLDRRNDNLNDMVEMIKIKLMQEHTTQKMTVEEASNALMYYAKYRTSDPAIRLYITSLIAYLEQTRLLKSDEYNGMVYLWEENGEVTTERYDK